MWTKVRVSLLVLGLFIAAGCASLGGYDETGGYGYLDQSSFYSPLDSYGSWVDVSPYGSCWAPNDVAWGWRPYSVGYWGYTDYGWTWISNEPFGWATYHYGRWFDDPQYGWVWVPGSEWAPAWVAWRSSDDWVGWAALPPGASWGGSGLSSFDQNSIPVDQWCFVPSQKFLNTNLSASLASGARNGTLVSRTRDITRFEVRDGRPVDRGPELAAIEKLNGRRPPMLKIQDTPAPPRGRAQAVRGGNVTMVRTPLPPVSVQPPPQPKTLLPAPALERRRQAAERQALAAQQRERAELQRQQDEEMRRAASAAAQQEIRQRQAAERQALEEQQRRESERMQGQMNRRFGNASGNPARGKR